MKTQLSILALALFSLTSFAQKDTARVSISGIYKTFQDYNSEKISYAFTCNTFSCKIKLHDMFSRTYIDIFSDGKKIRLSKDSTYGYRDCNGNDFRFFKDYDHEYQILEKKNIVIYKFYISVPTTSGKINELVPSYFFSLKIDGQILPLTILNLKKAFPDDLKFHDKLDIEFGDGTSIAAFDSAHKIFKINYLLSQLNINNSK